MTEVHVLAIDLELSGLRDHVAIPNPANPSVFYSLVTGQQHSHGVEVNFGGEILPNLRISAAATFLLALVTKDSNTPSQKGSDLLGAPRRVTSNGVLYGEPRSVSASLNYKY